MLFEKQNNFFFHTHHAHSVFWHHIHISLSPTAYFTHQTLSEGVRNLERACAQQTEQITVLTASLGTCVGVCVCVCVCVLCIVCGPDAARGTNPRPAPTGNSESFAIIYSFLLHRKNRKFGSEYVQTNSLFPMKQM